MTNADVAGQGEHVAGVEDIAHETVVLAQKQLVSVTGCDARRVLAAVLQHGQGIIDVLIDV